MTEALDKVVEGLLNGKKPSGEYLTGKAAEHLASALSARIDARVAPSLCAHAMCSSSAAGNVAVVRMLSMRPMSTFNKAYNFGEPLRRACRAFVKSNDPLRQKDLAECAKLIVAAHGDLDQPDKYLKSGMSAAGSLKASGTGEALHLLDELRKQQENNQLPSCTKEDAKIASKKRKATDVSATESKPVGVAKRRK